MQLDAAVRALKQLDEGLSFQGDTVDSKQPKGSSVGEELVPAKKSMNGLDDPFAGMSRNVNYQKEIERLKEMVQGSDKKKKVLPSTMTLQHAFAPTDLPSAATKSLDLSRSASPPCPDMSSTVSSRSSSRNSIEMDYGSDSAEEPSSQSTITEEEKARFIEFVHKWAGVWNGFHQAALDDQCKPLTESPWQDKRASMPARTSYSHVADTAFLGATCLSEQSHHPSSSSSFSLSHPGHCDDADRTPSRSVGIIGDHLSRRSYFSSHSRVFAA